MREKLQITDSEEGYCHYVCYRMREGNGNVCCNESNKIKGLCFSNQPFFLIRHVALSFYIILSTVQLVASRQVQVLINTRRLVIVF